MRQLYILLFFVIAKATWLSAQCWESQTSPTTAQLQATYFLDDQTGWASGADGTVLHTTDGGESWSAQSSGVNHTLYDIFFINGSTGWAVGSQGTILRTTNGGNSWSAQDAGTATDLYGLYMVSASEGWITGACGLILRTTNGGSTWRQQNSGQAYHLYDIAFNGLLGIAVGGRGTILRSTNGGVSWQSGFSTGSGNWRGLAVRGSSFIIANTEGEVGIVNGDATGYSPITLPTSGNWQGITAVTDDTWYLCGLDGTILRTDDAGSNWVAEDIGSNIDLYGVYFTSGGNGWTVGSGGSVLNICEPIRQNCDPVQDSLSLVAFFNATNGPNWTNSWNLNQPMRTWHGVVFDAQGDCIISLQLRNNGLSGEVPDGLVFTKLRYLDLSQNALTGRFPDLNGMPAIEFVALFENELSGTLPSTFDLPQLIHLDADSNQLQGILPDFSGAPNLEYLDLQNNQLSGAIPDLSVLPALDTFSLADNRLTFEDILPTHDANNSALSIFDYTGQDSIFRDTMIEVTAGTTIDIALGIDPGVSSNNYVWFKDGILETTISGNNSRRFTNISTAAGGVYEVQVNNPGAPNLTLFSFPIRIRVCPAPVEINSELCSGESLTVGGTVYDENNPTGMEVLTSANGCDSTVNVSLSFESSLSTTLSSTLCPGESITVGETIYDEDNPTGTEVLTAIGGCDSTVEISLEFVLAAITNLEIEICPGESYNFKGEELTEAGEYRDTLRQLSGCDSVTILSLNVATADTQLVEDSFCPGDTYTFGSQTLNEPGIYTETFTSQKTGCDSTVQLALEESFPEAVIAENDRGGLEKQEDRILLPVLQNDVLPDTGQVIVSIVEAARQGMLEVVADNQIRYTLQDTSYRGADSLMYSVCVTGCGTLCDTAMVTIFIAATVEEELSIPNAFTPNNDGLNDCFDPLKSLELPFTPDPETVKLVILNRWGEVIFEPDTYECWDGRVPGRSSVVPQDTYYFVLQYETDQTVVHRGAIVVLKRRE